VYEYLEGRVQGRTPTGLVLDVGGVGYALLVPVGSSFDQGAETVRVWTHLIVREDAHILCGFADEATRDLFRMLLSVRGVGASMAIGILSGLPREPLLAALRENDLERLTRVRGVGKKTAQQILLDLHDKALVHEAHVAGSAPAALAGDIHQEDAVRALISIGYKEKEARRNVERAAREADSGDLEQLVRTAIALG